MTSLEAMLGRLWVAALPLTLLVTWSVLALAAPFVTLADSCIGHTAVTRDLLIRRHRLVAVGVRVGPSPVPPAPAADLRPERGHALMFTVVRRQVVLLAVRGLAWSDTPRQAMATGSLPSCCLTSAMLHGAGRFSERDQRLR